MKLIEFVSAIAFATLAGAASAEEVLCAIQEQGRSGWIPAAVVLKIKPGEMTANDTVGKFFGQDTAPVEIITRTDKRITYGWDRKKLRDKTNQFLPTMRYRLTVYSDGKAKLNAQPMGYNNRFTGLGRCETE